MTVVEGTARDAAKAPIPFAQIRIALITGTATLPGYTADGELVRPATVKADENGAWSIDLPPTTGITPADTYFEFWESGAISTAQVPDTGGPYQLKDILVTAPPTPAAPGITGVQILDDGTAIATRAKINLIAGTNTSISAVDDPTTGSVDVTIGSTGGGGAGTVVSVNQVPPDGAGNIALTAADVGADAAGAAATAQAAAEASAASTYIPLSAEGAANGVATLDSAGHLSAGQAAKLAQRLIPTAVKTAAYTAQAGDLVIVDATGGTVPITLVSAPVDGTVIGVKMIATASSHITTATCGGTDVYNKTGGATVATLYLAAQAILLQYSASAGIWYVVGDDLPLTQLDARYVAKTSPVTLTDGANIATDASLGNLFRVTLGGNRTLSNPTNPTDGQLITWSLKQDATGSRTITLDTKFRFGTDITSITLTTTANKTDHLGARYNAIDDKFDVVAFVRGF